MVKVALAVDEMGMTVPHAEITDSRQGGSTLTDSLSMEEEATEGLPAALAADRR